MWKCNVCGAVFEKPIFNWAVSGGEKVDLLNTFCPSCPEDDMVFLGTAEEESAFWKNAWE